MAYITIKSLLNLKIYNIQKTFSDSSTNFCKSTSKVLRPSSLTTAHELKFAVKVRQVMAK